MAGARCKRSAVSDDEPKCFWHSRIPKTDEQVRRHFPDYSGIKQLIESKRPDLERAHFTQDDLSGIDFHGLNLRGALLCEAHLQDCDFSKADLESADIRFATLDGANLKEANLSSATLVGSSLIRARLDSAILRRTNMKQCNFSFASLRDVVLKNATWDFVNLYNADLTGVRYSNRTSQLRFANTSCPVNEDYFEGKLGEWVLISSSRNDALQIVQFLKTKLPKARFERAIRNVVSALGDHGRHAQQSGDFAEYVEIIGFLAQLFRITGDLRVAPLLPAPSGSLSPPTLVLRVSLLNNQISTDQLADFTHGLGNFLGCLQRLTAEDLAIDLPPPQIQRISLGSLSFDIVLPYLQSNASGAALFLALLFAVQNWILRGVLPTVSTYLDIRHKQIINEIQEKREAAKLPRAPEDQLRACLNEIDKYIRDVNDDNTYVQVSISLPEGPTIELKRAILEANETAEIEGSPPSNTPPNG